VNTDFVIGILAGIGGTLLGQRLLELAAPLLAPPKPMRLQRTADVMTFNALTADIAPPHRIGQWQTYTHAFIQRGEMCQRGPLNVREMRALTGLSYRQQVKYLDVLRGVVVDVVPSGGVRWRVGKGARRALLPTLPFPADFDPPPFGTLNAVQLQQRGTERKAAKQ